MVSKKQLENEVLMLKKYKAMCEEYEKERNEKSEYLSLLSKEKEKRRNIFNVTEISLTNLIREEKKCCHNITEAKETISQILINIENMKKQIENKISFIDRERKRRISTLEDIQKLESLSRFKATHEERKKAYEKKYKSVDGYKEFCSNDYPIKCIFPTLESNKASAPECIYKIGNDPKKTLFGCYDSISIKENEKMLDFLRKESLVPYEP